MSSVFQNILIFLQLKYKTKISWTYAIRGYKITWSVEIYIGEHDLVCQITNKIHQIWPFMWL